MSSLFTTSVPQGLVANPICTAALRTFARDRRRELLKEYDLEFLVLVADRLFTGRVLEEKIFAVLLLENLTHKMNQSHFLGFESWIDRISTWADHDGLVHYLIAPMVGADRKGFLAFFNGQDLPIDGAGAPPAWPSSRDASSAHIFPRYAGSPICFSVTRMTWFKKVWAGCFA